MKQTMKICRTSQTAATAEAVFHKLDVSKCLGEHSGLLVSVSHQKSYTVQEVVQHRNEIMKQVVQVLPCADEL